MSEPLSEEDMVKLRAMLADYARESNRRPLRRAPDGTPNHAYIASDIVSQAVWPLLAELDRLRALDLDAAHAAVDETMLAKYQAWYEASRPIVEAVAFASIRPSAAYRGDIHIEIEILTTIQDQARALLAKEGGVSGEPAIDFHHE